MKFLDVSIIDMKKSSLTNNDDSENVGHVYDGLEITLERISKIRGNYMTQVQEVVEIKPIATLSNHDIIIIDLDLFVKKNQTQNTLHITGKELTPRN